MFNSGITVKSIIDGLRDEVDIALSIPDSAYVDWLNALEQILYSEFIKETNGVTVTAAQRDNPQTTWIDDINGITYIDVATPTTYVSLDPIPLPAPARFEDIHTVYADDVQLIKSTGVSGKIFFNTWYRAETEPTSNVSSNSGSNLLCVNAGDWDNLEIFYFVRPTLKTVANKATETVLLPVEFTELVKSKLRGEAYKLANEDVLSAKWLGSYNALLEDFTAWLQARAPQFGV